MASEAFKAKLFSDIASGQAAEEDLLELQREEQVPVYEEDTW